MLIRKCMCESFNIDKKTNKKIIFIMHTHTHILLQRKRIIRKVSKLFIRSKQKYK